MTEDSVRISKRTHTETIEIITISCVACRLSTALDRPAVFYASIYNNHLILNYSREPQQMLKLKHYSPTVVLGVFQ